MGRARGPQAGDLRAGGVGGRTRATALFLLHHLLGVPCGRRKGGAVRPLTLPSLPGRVILPPPLPALPRAGPPGALAVALACEGLLALTARPGASAAPLHTPGDLPPGTRGAEECLRDGGCKIGMRGTPKRNGGRPRVILGDLSHILIIKSKIRDDGARALADKIGMAAETSCREICFWVSISAKPWA